LRLQDLLHAANLTIDCSLTWRPALLPTSGQDHRQEKTNPSAKLHDILPHKTVVGIY